MNFLDLVHGAGIVLFIVVLAGGIAYIGDRVGHQVGRKRLTLFNIRPRYTSTIIAIATGMIIALIVTLGAIFASNEVKTAFFRLNQINAEIARAQARATELETKLATGRLVVSVDTLMRPAYWAMPQNASSQIRHEIYTQFYRQTVAWVNRTYTPAGLRPFKAPPDVQRRLDAQADSSLLEQALAQSDVLLVAISDRNLYVHDEIHFQITAIPDVLIYRRGDVIAQETVPTGKNVSAQIALYELLRNFVPSEAVRDRFPPYFAGNVGMVQAFPSRDQMQRMLSTGKGNYVMTAFAAGDIYPHTFAIPVVVAMQKAP